MRVPCLTIQFMARNTSLLVLSEFIFEADLLKITYLLSAFLSFILFNPQKIKRMRFNKYTPLRKHPLCFH